MRPVGLVSAVVLVGQAAGSAAGRVARRAPCCPGTAPRPGTAGGGHGRAGSGGCAPVEDAGEIEPAEVGVRLVAFLYGNQSGSRGGKGDTEGDIGGVPRSRPSASPPAASACVSNLGVS